MIDAIEFSGSGVLCCWNPDGSLAWRRPFKNGVTLAGLDYILGNTFSNNLGAFPQITAWYAGLIDSVGFTALGSADTMASHTGWKENTGYSGNRPQWANAEGGQTASSNGPFTFPVTANGIINGMFICSNNAPGGTGGVLWATALLSTPATTSIGQSLTGTYSVTATGG